MAFNHGGLHLTTPPEQPGHFSLGHEPASRYFPSTVKIYTKSQAESIIRRADELERKGKTKKLERLQPWLKAAREHLATRKPVEV